MDHTHAISHLIVAYSKPFPTPTSYREQVLDKTFDDSPFWAERISDEVEKLCYSPFWHPQIRLFRGEDYISIFIWPSQCSPYKSRTIHFRLDLRKRNGNEFLVYCINCIFHPQINPITWEVSTSKYIVQFCFVFWFSSYISFYHINTQPRLFYSKCQSGMSGITLYARATIRGNSF